MASKVTAGSLLDTLIHSKIGLVEVCIWEDAGQWCASVGTTKLEIAAKWYDTPAEALYAAIYVLKNSR